MLQNRTSSSDRMNFHMYTSNKVNNFFISMNLLYKIIIIFKNHFIYEFNILTCISRVDNSENF